MCNLCAHVNNCKRKLERLGKEQINFSFNEFYSMLCNTSLPLILYSEVPQCQGRIREQFSLAVFRFSFSEHFQKLILLKVFGTFYLGFFWETMPFLREHLFSFLMSKTGPLTMINV